MRDAKHYAHTHTCPTCQRPHGCSQNGTLNRLLDLIDEYDDMVSNSACVFGAAGVTCGFCGEPTGSHADDCRLVQARAARQRIMAPTDD